MNMDMNMNMNNPRPQHLDWFIGVEYECRIDLEHYLYSTAGNEQQDQMARLELE